MNTGSATTNCIGKVYKNKGEEKRHAIYQAYIIHKYKKYIQTASKEQIKYLLSEKANCGLGSKSWGISPNGNVRPCVIMPENYLSLGNIFNQTVVEIASGRLPFLLNKVRGGSFRKKECRHCKNLVSCSFCIF